MKKNYLFILLYAAFFFFNARGIAQPLAYTGILTDRSGEIRSNTNLDLFFMISKNEIFNQIIFTEKQKIETDETGKYSVLIGRGQSIKGNIDSMVWSDGSFFLKVTSDTGNAVVSAYSHICQLRAPTEITPDGLEGSAESSDQKDWGTVVIANKNRRNPKKITADLITAYVNVDYPGGKYPVYRHFEWYDPDRDGKGNSLALTYSEKTTHAFFENASLLGEVKLYKKAFQEMTVSINSEQIIFNLSKPVSVQNLGVTYAVKGPWKILYYIEW